MTGIRKIGPLTPPRAATHGGHPGRRAERSTERNAEILPPRTAVEPPWERRREAPLRLGPWTPFLAQYVDQLWPWPRDKHGTTSKHATADRAYGAAEMLIEEIVRWRHTGRFDRRF